jgi:hypothetical protein
MFIGRPARQLALRQEGHVISAYSLHRLTWPSWRRANPPTVKLGVLQEAQVRPLRIWRLLWSSPKG